MALELKQHGYRPIVITRVPELIYQCQKHDIRVYKNIWLKNETRRRWLILYYLLYPILVLQYVHLIVSTKASLFIMGSRDDQIFGGVASKITRTPYIWIDHADMKGIVSQSFRFLGRSYYYSLRHAAVIVAVSKAERELIFRNLHQNQEKFVVINNGASIMPATPLAKPDQGFVISFVGRLEQDKGVFEIIEAAKAVSQEYPSTHFWLVGKGRAEQKLQDEIESNGLADNVKLLGHLDNVYQALRASDVFIYPSHHDASPLAPVEALLAGMPVIATNVGGIPEIIDASSGIIIEKGSSDQLAAAIIKLIGDKKTYLKLRDGAKIRGKQFDFNHVVTKHYLPLINRVIGND